PPGACTTPSRLMNSLITMRMVCSCSRLRDRCPSDRADRENSSVLDLHPTLAVDVATDHPRRVADRDTEVGQGTGDHRAGADRDVTADVGAGQDDGAVPSHEPLPTRTGREGANCRPIGRVVSS